VPLPDSIVDGSDAREGPLSRGEAPTPTPGKTESRLPPLSAIRFVEARIRDTRPDRSARTIAANVSILDAAFRRRRPSRYTGRAPSQAHLGALLEELAVLREYLARGGEPLSSADQDLVRFALARPHRIHPTVTAEIRAVVGLEAPS